MLETPTKEKKTTTKKKTDAFIAMLMEGGHFSAAGESDNQLQKIRPDMLEQKKSKKSVDESKILKKYTNKGKQIEDSPLDTASPVSLNNICSCRSKMSPTVD